MKIMNLKKALNNIYFESFSKHKNYFYSNDVIISEKIDTDTAVSIKELKNIVTLKLIDSFNERLLQNISQLKQ